MGKFMRRNPPWWGFTGRNVEEQLERLHRLDPNFALEDLPEVEEDPWHIDDYCRSLPAEGPGEPEPDGAFAAARRIQCDYEFADPSRVRAYYDTDAELLGRDMLLELRWHAIRVRTGVRVTQIFDELREVDGREVRVWGWAYQTLEGHIERGQMDYQLWKWLDTGEIDYRIHAVSQMAEVRDPIIQLGFRMVGRREQVAFARRCGERMEELVRRSLREGKASEPEPAEVGGTAVSPSPGPDDADA
jgi:uncharacterized protein (UPF0548 family)